MSVKGNNKIRAFICMTVFLSILFFSGNPALLHFIKVLGNNSVCGGCPSPWSEVYCTDISLLKFNQDWVML